MNLWSRIRTLRTPAVPAGPMSQEDTDTIELPCLTPTATARGGRHRRSGGRS